MKKIITLTIIALIAICARAQEPAKYRITYDCDAQYLIGKTMTYRWTLDVGETTAVFYNANNRDFNREKAEILSKGGAMALVEQLPTLGQKYPAKHDLQIIVGAPEKGKYTYLKQLLTSKLKYEETLPVVEWQMTDSTKTVCEYECHQAVGAVYGRTWTVWYAPELPMNYGPYILGGLPGLIMAARDADGVFDFMAVGVEKVPEGSKVEAVNADEALKCSRKRFLEMRTEGDGLSQQQMEQRALAEHGLSDSKNLVRVSVDANGKASDGTDKPRPKKNYLDKE